MSILISTIICFSFVKFEKVELFSLIDGNVNVSRNAILMPGSFFNVSLKSLAGDSNPE